MAAALGLAGKTARAEAAPQPAPIEAPAPMRALTMGEALAYAHGHQPAIAAALARVRARAAEAKIPSGQWLPTVGVTAQLFGATANNTTGTYVTPGFLDIPRIGATTATSGGSLRGYPSTLVAAGITQELFDFGRIAAQRAAADASVEVERQRAEVTRLDVDFGVEEAFFAVHAARAVVKASEDAFTRARIHRDLADAGVRSGLRPPIERTRAEADFARFDVGRVRALGGLALAQAVLAASIGSPGAAVDAAGEPPRPGDMPALPEAIAAAESRDPELKRALGELRAAEARTRAVAAELRPELMATGTVSGRAGGAPPSGAGQAATAEGWVPNVPNWDVGVVLSWPLFDGTIAARRDAAQTAEQVRREEIDLARQAQVASVRQSYVAVQVARTALEGLEQTVAAARANYDQADARFRAGLGTAVELADAEALRTDAEIQAALGQFELARARAAFGRAIAEGL